MWAVVVLSAENQRIELRGIAERQQRGQTEHVQFRWLKQVAVARRDSGVQVLDLLSGRTLAEVAVPAGEVLDVDLATDGTDVVLVAVGTGMLAVRWPLAALAPF